MKLLIFPMFNLSVKLFTIQYTQRNVQESLKAILILLYIAVPAAKPVDSFELK